ncbi:MAG: ABC transporter ATP-binding protein [Spirochaetaceae bacterium]|nr:ABC transporter ATP-binding protein [Spirochaetaceae bacterium]
MLKIQDVSVFYGHINALKRINLEVNEGEIVTLIGSNGAGKSTLLNSISGLVPVKSGSVQFNGEELKGLRPEIIAGKGVVQCPEGRKVFAGLSVFENLLAGGFVRRDRAGVIADAEKLMSRFPPLGERKKQLAGSLSGGEQQMLAICRCLMAQPRILLLDEPSMGLAAFLVKELFSLIREINAGGTTVLLVEQNAYMALRIAGRAYVLESGLVVQSGIASELLRSDKIRKTYLGETL